MSSDEASVGATDMLYVSDQAATTIQNSFRRSQQHIPMSQVAAVALACRDESSSIEEDEKWDRPALGVGAAAAAAVGIGAGAALLYGTKSVGSQSFDPDFDTAVPDATEATEHDDSENLGDADYGDPDGFAAALGKKPRSDGDSPTDSESTDHGEEYGEQGISNMAFIAIAGTFLGATVVGEMMMHGAIDRPFVDEDDVAAVVYAKGGDGAGAAGGGQGGGGGGGKPSPQ